MELRWNPMKVVLYYSSSLNTLAKTEGHVTVQVQPGPEWRWSVNVLSSKGLETSLAAAKESEDNQEKQELCK